MPVVMPARQNRSSVCLRRLEEGVPAPPSHRKLHVYVRGVAEQITEIGVTAADGLSCQPSRLIDEVALRDITPPRARGCGRDRLER
jgi:hypothetical protein